MAFKDLATGHCVPCTKATAPLTKTQYEPLLAQLEGWQVVEGHHLARDFRFKNFRQALAFVNEVGEIAETEGHHPDIHFTWGRARIEIFTHAIDGLSDSDFVLAAKIDRIGRADPAAC